MKTSEMRINLEEIEGVPELHLNIIQYRNTVWKNVNVKH